MIPKILHQFWDGPLQPPTDLMRQWQKTYTRAGWDYILWDTVKLNELSGNRGLINQKQFDAMPEWAGKCDIARYEILHHIGGFYVDADTRLIRILDDNLLENSAFCCYENEFIRPGLISNAYLATEPKSKLTTTLIRRISALKSSKLHPDYGADFTEQTIAWMTTGPKLLTETIMDGSLREVAILPSFYFIPNHYDKIHPASQYSGNFVPYAESLWGSTPGSSLSYQKISKPKGIPVVYPIWS